MAQQQNTPIPKWFNFVAGGLSGMGATCVVQPIDLIKTRMQLSGAGGAQKHKSMVSAFIQVARQESVRNLYKGLSAALLRQATYTTTRLGVYNTLMDRFSTKEPMPFWKKAVIGMTAGGVGAVVGTPAEVALIRMTADGHLPVEKRRNYKNVVDAVLRITKEEGVTSLWRGCSSTVMRAMVLNMAQLATYSQAKGAFATSFDMKEGIMLHFSASMVSGLIATAVSLPVDLLKTRIQLEAGGDAGFKAISRVFTSAIRQEGVLALWKGFTPYYLRLGPHTVITFMIMERLNSMYRTLSK